jgi:serine/threonine-protein kinase
MYMIAATPGQVLGGRYRLERLLGAGTVALVYEARDEQLERQVAVKILRPEWAQDPPTAAAFEREAQAGAGLHHPHLAQIYDAGTADGAPYIVMERVPGAPLDSDRRLAPAQAVDLGAQIAGALAFVHDHGLLHCDIKPANLLVDPAGQVKLVDFGVACPVDDVDDAEAPPAAPDREAMGTTLQLPAAHASPGMLPYLAPERLVGGPPSAAADVYSLGAILYTVLAGRPPFPGTTADAIAAAQRAGAPPALRDLNPAVPPALETAVAHAVAVDPAQRFATAREMEAALEAVRAQSRAHTAAVAAPPPVTFAPSDVTVANPVPPNAEKTVANTLPPSGIAQPAAPPNAAATAPAPYSPVLAPERPLAPPTGAKRVPRWIPPVAAVALLLALLVAGLALGGRGQPPTQAAAPAPATAPAEPPAPQFMGLTLDEARAAAQQDGWTLVEAPAVYNNSVRAGLILAQQPDAGTPLAPGAPITVTASLGAQPAAATAPPAVNNNPTPAPPAAGGNGNGNGDKDKGGGNDKGKGDDKGKGNDKKK